MYTLFLVYIIFSGRSQGISGKRFYFKILHEQDQELPANLRICPKITVNHLILNSSTKMRVCLAIQVRLLSVNMFPIYRYLSSCSVYFMNNVHFTDIQQNCC